MSDISAKELQEIHARVDADMEKNGTPSDEELLKELEDLDSTGRKTLFQQFLGV